MPAIRITTSLTNDERDSLYLNNIPRIVALFEEYYKKIESIQPLHGIENNYRSRIAYQILLLGSIISITFYRKKLLEKSIILKI